MSVRCTIEHTMKHDGVCSAHVLVILFAREKVTLKYGVYASCLEQFLPLLESLLLVRLKGFHNSVEFQSWSLLKERVIQ